MKRKFIPLLIYVSIFLFSCKHEERIFDLPDITLSAPKNGSIDLPLKPVLKWEGKDPQGKMLSYDVYLGMDSSHLFKYKGDVKDTTIALDEFKLAESGTFYWKIVAKNATNVRESPIWKFKVLPPGVPPGPDLIVPDKKYIRPVGAVIMKWHSVVDPEPSPTKVNYEIMLDSTYPPKTVIATQHDTAYSLDVSKLVLGRSYYWSVRAFDEDGNGSTSKIGEFMPLEVGAPDPPEIINPALQGGNTAKDVTLKWDASVDPEGDPVTYKVYFDDHLPATTLLATITGKTSAIASGLVFGKSYYWKVVASDPAGHSSSSITSSFIQYGKGAPSPVRIIDDFSIPGVASPGDHTIRWTQSIQPGASVKYDVYLDESLPSTHLVASDITDTSFLLTDELLSSDITNVKTFYLVVVAKDDKGNETPSVPLIFTPEMQGVFTDVRGSESLEYKWVRIGSQIWMAQNLKTHYFTDGSKIEDARGVSFKAGPSALYTDVYEDDINYLEQRGRVYTWWVASSDKIAPKGWHVANLNDIKKLNSYVQDDYKLLKTDYGWKDAYKGSNIYGFNLLGAGFRRSSGKWEQQNDFHAYFWTPDAGSGKNTGTVFDYTNNRFRDFSYGGDNMFGIRLVRD